MSEENSEPRPQVACKENLVKFEHIVFLDMRADKQQTYRHAYRSTSHTYRRRNNLLWTFSSLVCFGRLKAHTARSNLLWLAREFISDQKQQEAQLSHIDRATRSVSWNLVNCCTAVRKITFERFAVGHSRLSELPLINGPCITCY